MIGYSRFIIIGAACVLLLPAAAASRGSTTAGPSNQVRIWTEFGSGQLGTVFTDIVKTWNKAHPELQIAHRPIPNNNFYVVTRTGMAGSNPPDLLQWEGGTQTSVWAKAKKLVDVTSWWKANKSRFVLQTAGEVTCSYKGKMYCIPYDFAGVNQLYYNKDLLAKNNIAVPRTWPELLAAAEQLKQAGVIPIAFGGKDGWPGEHIYMWMLAKRCGPATVAKAINTSAVKFTDPCFVGAASDFQMLQQKGYFSPGAASDDYPTGQAVFNSGKAAFYHTGSWYAATPPKGFKLGVITPAPGVSKNATMGSVVTVLGIPSKSKNQAGAYRVLDYLASLPVTAKWVKTGEYSVIKGAIEQGGSPLVKTMWAGSYRTATNTVPFLELVLPLPIGEEQIYKGTVGLLTGQMTPDSFSKSIQDALDKARSKTAK